MPNLFDNIIGYTGMIEVIPSFWTLYFYNYDVASSILNTNRDNFYFIYNLPITPLYFDSYILQTQILRDYFTTLQYEYKSLLDVERDFPVCSTFRYSHEFLYSEYPITSLIPWNGKSNIMIFFDHYDVASSNLNLNWLLNYQLQNNLIFLKDLKYFCNSVYWSYQYDLLTRNFESKGFYFYFLYNRWDFEMVIHSVFSLWWPFEGHLFDDNAWLYGSGLLNWEPAGYNIDTCSFNNQWIPSSELRANYYKYRFGKPCEDYYLTEYGYFQLENNYILSSFLKNKNNGLEYLSHISQYKPPIKTRRTKDWFDSDASLI